MEGKEEEAGVRGGYRRTPGEGQEEADRRDCGSETQEHSEWALWSEAQRQNVGYTTWRITWSFQ